MNLTFSNYAECSIEWAQKIEGIGSNFINSIEGVSHLHGTEHTMLPDMVEIGSWIGLTLNDTF